ncbi:MAG: hypothetical protein L6R38_003183 [Xanthoria sp. 2 TBL-2021]|nr:MAG: hypothetical protein L6R38_003183 [Xanthoria sp. 2 TBL-2021]
MYMLPSLILSLLLCLYSCTATLYNSTIAEVIPQLFASFPDVGEYSARLTKDYTYGRQDMGKCCALAVLESFVEYNDTVTLANDSFIGDDLDGFRRHPRPWKIKIPDELFNVPLNAMTSAPRTPFIALLAMLLVSIDTIVWLMTVFALAGPILVSGIYEASIDSRILAYLQEKIRNHQLSVFQRAQLMYVVLVGNLDMLAFPPGGDDHDTLLNHIEGPEGLLQRLIPRENKKIVAKSISTTKTRLNALLFVQYDFGVTVGAPVVFFCGSFLYTLFDNFAHVGDNDVGHAIGTYSDETRAAVSIQLT